MQESACWRFLLKNIDKNISWEMEAHLQYVFDIAWSNEDSDGMEAGHLETLYGIPGYVQNAVFSLHGTDN